MSTRAFVPRLEDRRERDPGSRLAVFDLDRTLLPGSSLMLLAQALQRAGVLSRRHLLAYAARDAAFARRGEGGSTAARILAGLLGTVAGQEAAPVLEVAGTLGEELAGAAYPAGRRLLEQHLGAGDFCVVVSAGPRELVEVAARALGAHRAVGTRAEVLDGRFTGRLDGPFCHGRGKLARLWIDLGTADLSEAAAYSDSASDLPLLRAAGRPVAVNPDRHLRKVAAAAGWPVLRFSRHGVPAPAAAPSGGHSPRRTT